MTSADTRPSSVTEQAVAYIQWGAVLAGAITAAALAFVLHTFGSGIGIAVSSTSPTWRDGSTALWLLSGLYLLLVAFVSYGLGGYIAGRARTRFASASLEEVEIRDGGHGLVVWAVATLLTGLLAFGAAQSLARLAAPSSGASGPASSVAGENIIAYELDKLFRADRPPTNVDRTYPRAEAGRILLTAGGHAGIAADDRGYLVRLVAGQTGLAEPEAQRRVDSVIASARDNIARFRRSAVVLTFMAGAAALLGAVVAWFAACAGGRHRDGLNPFRMSGWSIRGPNLREQ
jgi:hypothetical protein